MDITYVAKGIFFAGILWSFLVIVNITSRNSNIKIEELKVMSLASSSIFLGAIAAKYILG